jgi:hypothetical protein
MAKLHVFAIGGTGSRIVKSLTMLLGAGMDLNGFDLVPIFIDPDKSNGDLTRTINYINSYRETRSALDFGESSNGKFFKTKIGTGGDESKQSFRLTLKNVENDKFKDYIGHQSLSNANRAMMEMLFSEKNLESEMEVGFKGNPNIGSVVLNQLKSTQAYIDFATDFQDGDRIFIVSSIFGGTGAAGFPLILKNIKERDEQITNWALIQTAPIGAITVLPYFNIKQDNESEINQSTFISKAKAALDYYKTNVKDLNAHYYIADQGGLSYDNHEGAGNQKNKAHFVELAGALAIINFSKTPDNQLQSDSSGNPINPMHLEYGLENDSDPIEFSDLTGNLSKDVKAALTRFLLFSKYCDSHIEEGITQAWAVSSPQIDNSFISSEFYSKSLANFRKGFNEWLIELDANSRSFSPFELDIKDKNILSIVRGVKPRTKFLEKGSGYSRVDHLANRIEKAMPRKSVENKFMTVLYGAMKDLTEEKYNY